MKGKKRGRASRLRRGDVREEDDRRKEKGDDQKLSGLVKTTEHKSMIVRSDNMQLIHLFLNFNILLLA